MEKRRTQPLKVISDNRNKNLVSFYYSEREKNKRLFIDEFKNISSFQSPSKYSLVSVNRILFKILHLFSSYMF